MAKYARTIVVGTGTFIGTSIVLASIGSAITGYGAARRSSVDLRRGLAESMQSSAVDLSSGLRINVAGLTPGAQLVMRCGRDELPEGLASDKPKVCADAALEEIKEEQDQGNRNRKAGDTARALVTTLHDQLEEPRPSIEWNAVVSGFNDLSGLETSTRCGQERMRLVNELESPADPPISGGSLVPRKEMLDSVLQDAFSETVPGAIEYRSAVPGVTVRAALLGPDSAPGQRCDDHGADFPFAFAVMSQVLVSESSAVAATVQNSHLSNLDDKAQDVLVSLGKNILLLVAVAVTIGAWVFGQVHPKDPGEPIKVTLVRSKKPSE